MKCKEGRKRRTKKERKGEIEGRRGRYGMDGERKGEKGGRERKGEGEGGRERGRKKGKEKESREEGGKEKEKEKLRGVKVPLNGRGEDKGGWGGGTTERRLRGQRNGRRQTGKGD